MKSKDEVLNVVYSVIETHQGRSIENRNEKYNFVTDSSLDSFALLSFIMEVEEIFSIQFSPEELSSEDIQLVMGLVDLVIVKLNKLDL